MAQKEMQAFKALAAIRKDIRRKYLSSVHRYEDSTFVAKAEKALFYIETQSAANLQLSPAEVKLLEDYEELSELIQKLTKFL